jgi:hypothetical protein
MSSPQVAAGDRIVDPMITLAGCSTRQRIPASRLEEHGTDAGVAPARIFAGGSGGHAAPQPAPLVYRSNPKLLRVQWRLALFRPAWLLRCSLQWRQLWLLLDADADRADLELRLIKLLLKDRARVHPFAGNGG